MTPENYSPLAQMADTGQPYVDPFESQGFYGAQGFIPGQNNGQWLWQGGAPAWAAMMGPEWTEMGGPADMNADLGIVLGSDNDPASASQLLQNHVMGSDNDPYAPPTTSASNFTNDHSGGGVGPLLYDDATALGGYFNGGGSWIDMKNPVKHLDFSPVGGYSGWDDKIKTSGQITKAVVMAALAAASGGAGAALGGLAGLGAMGAGAMAGGAAALPSALAGGFNTGDWGKAATGVGLGALGGGAVGGLSAYGNSLGSSMNLPMDNPYLKFAGNTAMKAGTGMAKAAISGKDPSKAGLSSLQGSALSAGIKGISGLIP